MSRGLNVCYQEQIWGHSPFSNIFLFVEQLKVDPHIAMTTVFIIDSYIPSWQKSTEYVL